MNTVQTILLVFLLLTGVSLAEEPIPLEMVVPGEAVRSALQTTTEESVVVSLDDGTLEGGFSLVEPPEFVQLATMPDARGGWIEAMEVCFISAFEHLEGEFEFEYILYSAGPGPLPGVWPVDQIGFLPATNGETIHTSVQTCLPVAIEPFPVGDVVFFGARWAEPGMLMSGDENSESSGPGYARRTGVDTFWFPLGRPTFYPEFRNLGLRLLWRSSEAFSDGFESGDTSKWIGVEGEEDPE